MSENSSGFKRIMVSGVKDRWLLCGVLALFVIFKIPHLFYPYYWDESWPYAAAIKSLQQHGISLMPNAIDPELSRGHPLFFHAVAAMWMNVFGSSHLATHSLALIISLAVLVLIYEAGYRLFNRRVAVIALLLTVTQVIFFVQSSFVLLEMLVALLAFSSLYCYSRGKYLSTAILLTALFYTKESGLVLGLVLGIDALAGLFNKKAVIESRLLRCVSVMIPCLLIAVYFILQKKMNGWYIFPLHHDLTEHIWKRYWYNLRVSVLDFTFCENLRNWTFLLIIGLSLLAAKKNKNWHFGAIALTGLIIFCLVDDMRPGRIMPSIPFFTAFIASVVYLICFLARREFFPSINQRRFIRLSIIFVLCFLCFCPLNFFTPRYLLAAFIPLLFISAVLFDLLISRTYPQLYYPVVAYILLIAGLSFAGNKGIGDCDLGAFDGMDVQQHVVSYLEQSNSYEKQIGCGSFLESEHLTEPASGFLHSGKIFGKVRWEINAQSDVAIFDNIEPDNRHDAIKKDSTFRLVYRYAKGDVWAEIYGHK